MPVLAVVAALAALLAATLASPVGAHDKTEMRRGAEGTGGAGAEAGASGSTT